MGGWMLAGIRRNPGPLIGTLVAAATAATLTVAGGAMLGAHTEAPAGRLAGASVVVAGDTQVTLNVGGHVDANAVPAQRGGPAEVLAQRIKAALHGGRGYTIATGAARGDVANLDAATERETGLVITASIGPAIVMIALFVLAGTTALS